MKYAICAIIKDERRYLEEWIIHCLSIGFSAIHLYEDYGSESHKDITDKYDRVHLHFYDEVEVTDYTERDKKQIDLFNHFAKQYRSEYDWCAFIDPDEYIRFEEGYTIDRLCSEFSSYNGIMLQQKTYGANGHIQRPEGGVQENYTANPMEYHKPKFNMKTIVNLKADIQFKGVHRIQGAVFTNYTGKLKQPVCYQKAWYDHYYTKSWQDWMERFTKRGDVVPGNVSVCDFFNYNHELSEVDVLKSNISIPKKIHYCWFGKSELPEYALRCIESWQKYMPEYEIIRWDEDSFDINKYDYTKRAYLDGNYAFVSDVARNWILYKYGGVYLDLDVELVKTIDDVVQNGAFFSLHHASKDDEIYFVNEGNGFACEPNNLVVLEILNRLLDRPYLISENPFDTISLVQITTDVLCQLGMKLKNNIQNIKGVTVYPTELFCPLGYKEYEPTITKNTYSIHWFSSNWGKYRIKRNIANLNNKREKRYIMDCLHRFPFYTYIGNCLWGGAD